jgi:hypothetical protein
MKDMNIEALRAQMAADALQREEANTKGRLCTACKEPWSTLIEEWIEEKRKGTPGYQIRVGTWYREFLEPNGYPGKSPDSVRKHIRAHLGRDVSTGNPL